MSSFLTFFSTSLTSTQTEKPSSYDLHLAEDPLARMPRTDHIHKDTLRVVQRSDRLELRHRFGIGPFTHDLLDLPLEDSGPNC